MTMEEEVQTILSCFWVRSEGEAQQIGTLLYCLGREAEDVLGSTNITEDEWKQYNKVLEKFDSHFQVRRNLLFERARFNKCDQREDESAEQYITALYQLAERCKYRDFKPEMIRDRLVVSIRNTALSEKLQMDTALTLEKAKRLIRQNEVHEQQEILKDPKKDTSAVSEHNLDYVKNKMVEFHKEKGHKGRTQMNQSTDCQSKCTRCGKPKHAHEKCPAREAKCFKCQKVGHFSSLCHSKQVSAMTDQIILVKTMECNHCSKQ